MKKNTEEYEINKSFSQTVHDSYHLYDDIIKILHELRDLGIAEKYDDEDGPDILKDMEHLVIVNNSYLMQSLEVLERMNVLKKENSNFRDLNMTLQTRCDELESYKVKFEKVVHQNERIKMARSFRISKVLVDAIKKPGKNTIFFPYKILKIFYSK